MPKNCGERLSTEKLTSEPIKPGESGSVLAEFGGLPVVTQIFGLKRGKLYQLIGTGAIKSVCLRKPGSKWGTRLVHLQSVRDWLNGQLVQGNAK